MNTEDYLSELQSRYPQTTGVIPQVRTLIEELVALYRAGGTFFIAGNGGSAADAEHICGELLKGFRSLRPLAPETVEKFAAVGGESGELVGKRLQQGLKTISLLSHPALTSAFGNDVDPELAFAQQLWSLSRSGDIFMGISTGGNAANIRKALISARVKGVKTVLLTGNRHGCCEQFSDLVIAVPESETYKIQELHLPIYHAVCAAVENAIFG